MHKPTIAQSDDLRVSKISHEKGGGHEKNSDLSCRIGYGMGKSSDLWLSDSKRQGGKKIMMMIGRV